MILKRSTATVVSAKDLSATAREVTLSLPEKLDFLPGAFINVFIPHEGGVSRRAYSISSSPNKQKQISLSIRRTLPTSPSAVFWDEDIVGKTFPIMGPLGVNTIDKISRSQVYLIGFGIGVSVIKGMLHGLLDRADIEHISIITASRTEEDVLYREFFDACAQKDARVRTQFVVSQPKQPEYSLRGHIQDYIHDIDFSNASIYLCGSLHACETVQTQIQKGNFQGTEFFVESFDG